MSKNKLPIINDPEGMTGKYVGAGDFEKVIATPLRHQSFC